MPEEIKYSISLPDGRQTEWDQKQYKKAANSLYEKYPDAEVKRYSTYTGEGELSPDSSFHITLGDGRETDWDAGQFSKAGASLMEKYPDAKISIVDDLTARRNRDFVHQYEYAQSKVADPSLTVAEKKQYEDFVGTHSERYEGMKDRYGDSGEKDSFLKGEDTEPVTGYFARLKQNTKRMWGDMLYGVGELMDINSRSYTGPSKVDTGLAKEALSLLEDREKKGEKSLQLEELLKGDTSKMSPEEKEEYNHAVDVERYLALRAGASKNTDSAKALLTREVYGDEKAKEIKEKGAKIQDENSQEGKGIAAKAADLTYLAGAGLAAIGATALGQPEIGAAIGNAAFASFAASSAGSSMRAARDAGATDEETMAAGTASAAIMYLVGRIPFLKNMKIASRATSTKAAQAMTEALSNPAVKESVMKEAGKLTKEAAEALGMTTSHYIKQILGQTASSSATFAAMNGMEALVPLIYANPEEYPVLNQVTKSVAEGAIDGAIMGALFGGVSSGSEYIARRNHIRSQMAKNGGVAAAAMDLSKGEARVWNEKTGQFEQVETPPEAGWGEILGVQKGQAQEGEAPEWVHVLFNGKYYTVKSDAIARETVTLFTPKDLDKASRDAFTSEGETRGREADTPLLRGAIRQEKDYLDRKTQYEESNGGVTETTQLDIDRNNAALEGRRDATLSEIVNKVGRQQFWKAKSGPDNSVINTVDVVTFEDGSQGYVVSEDEFGLAVVSEKGKNIISKDDPQITNRQTYDLNEYLDSVVAGQDSAAETERMSSDQADNLAAVQERLVQEGKINVGTEEAPVIGTLVDADITPTGGAYLQVEGEKEMRFVPWKEVASSLGMSLDAKTDAQIADDRLSGEVKAREYNKLIPMGTEFQVPVEGSEKPVDLKFKEASVDEDGNLVFTVINTETGQESPIPEEMAMQGNLGQIIESLRNPESVGTPVEETPAEMPVEDTTLRDFRGNEIPLKTDGTVDQKALWNKDPEAWAKWNDSVRQDGGANSRGYIAKATKKLQSDAKAVQKQIAKELDFDKIESLEGQLAGINNRIADLERIENNYANAEVAQAEAEQTPEEAPAPVAPVAEVAEEAPVAETVPEVQEEQVPLTPDQVLEGRLAEAKTPEEKRQALEEYYAAIGTEQPIVATRGTIREVLESIGCSEATIDYIDGNLEDRTQLVEGFRVKGRILIIADDIRNAQRARLAYVHERQHTITSQNGYAEQLLATMPDATEGTLLPIVNKASGANYAGATLKELADEIVSLGMEIAYDSAAEDLEENLRSAGLDVPEIINFVKTIDDEQRRNGEALSLARRDRTYARNYTEASQRQDGGDSATRPEGDLDGQATGSEGSGVQGAEGRGLDTTEAGEVAGPIAERTPAPVAEREAQQPAPNPEMQRISQRIADILSGKDKTKYKSHFYDKVDYPDEAYDEVVRQWEENKKGIEEQRKPITKQIVQLVDRIEQEERQKILDKVAEQGKTIDDATLHNVTIDMVDARLKKDAEYQNLIKQADALDALITPEAKEEFRQNAIGMLKQEYGNKDNTTNFVIEDGKLTSYMDAPTGQESPSAPDETLFSLRREADSTDGEGKPIPGLRTLAEGFLDRLADKPLTPEELAIGSDAIKEMVGYMMPYLDMVKDGKRYLPEEIFGKGWSTIFKNGSYGRTMENTLICMRTLAYNDFVNAVQEKVGRPLTPTESFLASQMLYDIATDPQCLYCYVALDRKAYNGFLKTYIEQRDAVLDKYKADDSIDKTYRLPAQAKSRKNRKGLPADNQVNKLYLEYLDGRADTPSMRNRFNGWLDRIAEGTLIGMKDLTSPETRQKVAGKGASYAAQIDDAEKYAQSASWAKKQEEYRAYNGELLSMPQKVVDLLNSEYGLRFYSFSEYSPAFIVENMQMVRDAALRGLVGLAYTKEIDFAKIFAPTGININISCYGREAEDGTVVMDTKQGADWGEAQALRERYGNVGCVFVATNDRMVEWAIHQPWVDVVIPFHIVRTGEDIAKFYDWTNYTAMEADKDVKGRSRDIMPTEHMNDKDTFLHLCEERGLKPRFADLILPSTGRSVTEDPDYMKLVNETRRSVNETVRIKPIFDTQEARRSFDEFVEKGGYYAGWFTEEGAFERGVEQVAADVVAGKTAKDVDYGRQDIKASAEKLAAMAGKKKRPRSHQGTPRRIGGDKITKAQQNVLNYLETGEFKSEREPLEVANANQKQPVSEAAEPVVTEEDVMFRLSKNNKATVESWLKKREDINDEQRAEVVDYIDKLDDAKTQLATAKWFANGTIRIPEDMKKVQQAISVSGKAKVDPLRYNSPMELLDAHAEFKPSEERINPDEVSTLHRAAEYPDGIVVYDVDNTKESRENMRKIINTHFGEDASPWCLLQGDGKGNLTESSAKYWKHYNAYPKQVAFKDGKLLAFSANDTHTRVWWDRQDQSHYGIPLTKKVEGDELGRTADHIFQENAELGRAKADQEKLDSELARKYNCPPYRLWELASEEDKARLETAKEKVNEAYINGGEPGWIVEPGGHMYRGNKQNGVYEEWNSAGDQLLLRTEYKDGKENGVTEQWYPSGQLWKRAVMKDDGYAGPYEMWYENGQQKMRVEMNERGEKDGEQLGWYKNGNRQYEARYSDGHFVGDRIDYYESGEPKSIIHYDETGGMTGFEDYVIWRGEKGAKAHVGLGRRVTYAPGDSNRRTEEEFRANGKLHKKEEYHGSKLDGIVEYYYPDGTLQTRTHFVEGERNGTKEVYHENGKLWLRGDFKDGEVDGLQEQWNKEGDLILREEWKNGEKVRTLPLDENVQFRKVEPIVDEKNEELFEQAKKTFGTTDNLSEAGYVIPDGSMLDFSGRHLLDPGQDSSWMNGLRQVDHREISDLNYEKDGNTPSGYETDMRDFIRRGAIRLNSGVINLATKPTKGQENVLWGLIQRANGDVDVDFGDGYDSDHYASYNHARPERILNDIRRYFDEGIEPEGNVMFRKANQTQNGFISNAQMALDKIKMDKATPEQWIKMLEKEGGLKAGEDKWLGLSDWLKESDRKTLTKDEVAEFIAENRIQIEETKYKEGRRKIPYKQIYESEQYAELNKRFKELVKEDVEELGVSIDESCEVNFENLYTEIEEKQGKRKADLFYDGFDYDSETGDLSVKYNEDGSPRSEALQFLGIEPDNANYINSTRLYYTTEGLENKAEIALTVPTIDPWNEGDKIHFGDAGEGRAVAWIRFGDAMTERGAGDAPLEVRYKGAEPADEPHRRAVEGILLNWNDNESVMRNERRENQFWAAKSMFENSLRDNYYEGTDEQRTLRAQTLAVLDDIKEEDFEPVYEGGQRVLVIDEIQSKRHQEGREKGYQNSEKEKEVEKRYMEADLLYHNTLSLLADKYNTGGNIAKLMDSLSDVDRRGLLDVRNARANALEEYKKYFDGVGYPKSVPAAPFEKNWHELAMKRMLRLAAEEGYDKLAWTTGEQQIDRYNLANVIHGIRVVEAPDGNYSIITESRDGTEQETFYDVPKEKLQDYVGKELAVRIVNGENRVDAGNGKTEQIFRGLDLKVGGEGMKGFYDDILPRFMNKYGKKWGVKVQDINLPNIGEASQGLTMHSVDVTPEMKESVMEGQVMFRRSPITPEQDKEYMEAVDKMRDHSLPIEEHRKAVAKVKSMISDAFMMKRGTELVDEKENPIVMWHTTQDEFTVFDKSKLGKYTDHSASNENYAKTSHIGFWSNIKSDLRDKMGFSLGDESMPLFIETHNPLRFESLADLANELGLYETGEDFANEKKSQGYDSVIINDEEFGGISCAVFNANQLKSAALVTYDDNGNVIPLSERFNEESDDIRFSLRGIIGAENAEDEVALDNLEVAEEMENAGKDSQTIWRATGWERGADGKWRNEIPDAKQKEGVSLKKHNIAGEILDAPELFDSYPELAEMPIDLVNSAAAGEYNQEQKRITLDTDYNTTFEMSKEDKKKVEDSTIDFIRNGIWKRQSDIVKFKNGLSEQYGKLVLNSNGIATLLHELQHAIQQIEGFAKGTNEKLGERLYYKEALKTKPEETYFAWFLSRNNSAKKLNQIGRERVIRYAEIYDKSRLVDEDLAYLNKLIDYLKGISDDEYKKLVSRAAKIVKAAEKAGEESYEKSAGEVEARNVEQRALMTEEGRKEFSPDITEDTSRHEQIVLFRLNQDAVQQSREGGLTGVIGDENAAELYRNVYKAVPKEIRQQIVDKAGDGYLFSEATKDMISEAVEKGDKTGIAGLAANMLRDYAGPLDEKTARYILWRGDRKQEDDDLLDTVKDIAMQRKLRVGEFAEQPMFRLADNIEDAENRAESMADDAKATLNEKKEFAKVNDALTTIKAMSLQKEYDRKTVNTITVLAKNILKDQSIDAMSRWDISRLLGFVTSSVGKSPKTVKKNADALVGMVIDHLLRSEETKLGMLASIKASKTNQAGVEVQGALDVHGQNVLKAYKAGLDMDLENPEDEFDGNTIKGRLNTLSDRLSSEDDAVRSEAEDEYAGLMLAQEYQEKIKASVNEERGLKNEMKEAAEAYRDGNMSRTGYNQYVEEAENNVRENKIERIEAYRDLRLKMLQMMEGSIDARKEFTEREKQRVEEIHHLANSDMQGEDASPFKEPTRMGRFANSSIVRFFSKPLITFDQMLRLFGQKNVAGEGYLFNKFHRGWIDATEKAYLGDKQAKEELDAKVSEVFDKKMRWSDLYAEERKMPTVKVKWWDGGQMKEHELTQGNLLYIYMVNKMTDGRMKLRRMGITDEHVDAIKKQMDERFIELADWLQSEYLVNKRNKYNAVHERLFGASMAAIEDYFPLKINKRSLNRAEDIGRPEFDDALPATTTGSIIKRKRNAQDLDLLGADAFSVVIEHIEQMEQWAAFAEFNKDLNTLLSYKRFRNQVQNMDSVYGSGNELWKNFKSVCRIAGGTYNPAGKKSDLDTAALNIAKGVTSAKISFRIYTALKQFLSMPAFVSDANPKYLAQNLATPWKAWNWAMENLPMYEKRWKSRMVGDTRLMNTESDWKFFRSKVYDTLSRLGMSPNAFVDAMTIAIGSHSMYQTRYDRYIQDGYTEEQADKKAKQDATTLYNETQQSNEAAFVSPVQLDRTVLATMLTVFRNSSMGYQRQLHDAIRNIGKMMKPGYRAASIEFMKKQMERDGLTEEQAEHAANRNYEREKWRSAARVATFGFLVQFAWNLGGSIAYLLFGDDDDKKEEMLTEALIHGLIGGSMEGLAGGNVISEALNMVAKGESLNNYDPSLLPIISDMKSAYKKMSYDPVAGSNDLFNLAIQAGIGVNPQTLTDAVVAVVDACGGDLETSTEAMLLIMRVLQVPQSQVDQIYIDELGMNADKARTMSPGEMAERYARYKVAKGAPLTGWAYSDEAEEKREKAYLKRFKKLVNERKSK